MKAQAYTLALVLASALAGSFACSKADNDKKEAPAPLASEATVGSSSGDTALSTISCDETWKTFVAGHPVGLILNFTTIKQSAGADGTTIDSSGSTSEDVIVVSDDSLVTTKRTTTMEGLSEPVISVTTLKKSEWVKGCNQLTVYLSKNSVGGKFEISDKVAQTIDVPAGTFGTEYVTGKVTGVLASGTTTFHVWNLDDGSGIVAKAVVETASVVGDADLVTTNTTELTKIIKP